jgi:hypothetical protein
MRELTATLIAAQQSDSAIPYVKLEANNTIAGVARLKFTRLYSGSEPDYFHAAAMPSDGSLVRVRITPASDAGKLYYQRVAAPGEDSGFSQWTYAGQYNCVVTAAAACRAEVSIFWIKSDLKIQRIKSTDNGISWGGPELIDYAASSAINGICAAYKPNGDLALFFADQATLYVKLFAGGIWQARTAWDKATGGLSGASVVYDNGWNLFITGKDTAGNFKLWSLGYSDSGTWSILNEIATAPAASGYEYHHASLAKPDVFRCFYVEKYSGEQAYSRPFWTHTAQGSTFSESLWREAMPFDLNSDYGLDIVSHGDYCWLASPGGVWKASLNTGSVDLSADVLSLWQDSGTASGTLVAELRNDDARFNPVPSLLQPGCELRFSPGYRTSAGEETSDGQSFRIIACEQHTSGGKSSLVLYAQDAWHDMENWQARHQFRWNRSASQKSVKEMLSFVLGKAGIRLEVISMSDAASSFFPDFSVNAGENGHAVVSKLLSFVPDMLFIEGNTAFLINPGPDNAACYSYGVNHAVIEGRYACTEMSPNSVHVEGLNTTTGTPIIVNTYDWESIENSYARMELVEDPNIGLASQATQRGEALLRQSGISSADGIIKIMPNVGQQLYDVIEVTDARAGLSAARYRVLGLSLSYAPGKSEYRQIIALGGG